MIRKFLAVSLALSLFAPAAGAAWLGDVVLGVGARLGDRAAREAGDKAYETAKDEIGRLGRTGGRPGETPGRRGKDANKSGIRPSEVFSRYDFVPGDRVLFFDDFHDADTGHFPKRWTLKGPDTNTRKVPIEVAQYGHRKWIRYRPSNEREDARVAFYTRMDAGKDMPAEFTVEFDAVLPAFDGTDQKPEYRVLLINHGRVFQQEDFKVTKSNVVRIGSIGAGSGNTELSFEKGDGQIHRVEIRVEGMSVKAYLDGELVVNDPDGIVRPVTTVGMELAYQTGPDILPLMFTDFRVAAVGRGGNPATPLSEQLPSNISRSGPDPASHP